MRFLAALRIPALLLVACGAAAIAVGTQTPLEPVPLTGADGHPARNASGATLPDVVDRVTPAVVSIYTTRAAARSSFAGDPFGMFGGSPKVEQGLGSGVIVRADGIIVTNNHVVDAATELRVVFADRRELRAKVLGRDPQTDVAVLRVEASSLPTVVFGDSTKVRVGETVVAIGNSMGIGQTVSYGIVSAKGRANMGIVDDEDFVQTDAAINPGNSGGPLVNLRGEVIGINTAIATRTGGFQGIGFAIPSRMVGEILEILLREGRVSRGQLGVIVQDLTPALSRAFRSGPEQGVIITELAERGAAREAGIHRGDIVMRLDGKPVESSADLRHRVAMRGGGARVRLEVWRDGKTLPFSVRLKELGDGPCAAPEEDPPAEENDEETDVGMEGIAVDPVSRELLQKAGVTDEGGGLMVTSMQPAATITGLRRGDVIVEAGRRPVRTIAELREAVKQSADPVLLRVRRVEGSLYVSFPK